MGQQDGVHFVEFEYLQPMRLEDRGVGDGCSQILHSLQARLRTGLFAAEVRLYSGDMNEDFRTLSSAYLMVGGLSTFSLWAGVIGRGRVILPKWNKLFLSGRWDALPNVEWRSCEQRVVVAKGLGRLGLDVLLRLLQH